MFFKGRLRVGVNVPPSLSDIVFKCLYFFDYRHLPALSFAYVDNKFIYGR